jgi:uncharacterized protein YbjT (DUF2867 family)
MDRRDKTILVIGATGRQGGAAITHLMADGWRLRALAHHADSPAATALAHAGVEVVPGDLLDRTSLARAVEGVYGVFSMQSLREGSAVEEEQGKNVADMALAAGVEHFVYDSVAGADAEAGPPWVVSKHRIEAYIRKLGLPATIWRPVTFMENYERQRDNILAGHLTSPMWPETMSYMIAVDDIGRFVALAFSEPERFIGTSMAIGGDSMTLEQVAEVFATVLGTPVEFQHADMEGMPTFPRPKPGEPQPVRADIAACRELLPDMTPLSIWVEKAGWKSLVSVHQ